MINLTTKAKGSLVRTNIAHTHPKNGYMLGEIIYFYMYRYKFSHQEGGDFQLILLKCTENEVFSEIFREIWEMLIFLIKIILKWYRQK